MKRALKRMFDGIVERAKETLLKDGHHKPIVLLIGGTKNKPEITTTIPIKSTSDDEVRRVVKLFQGIGAIGYMTVSEEATTERDIFKPSQKPEKKEAIFVGLYTQDFQKAVMFIFERRGKEIVFTDEIPVVPLPGGPLLGINLN